MIHRTSAYCDVCEAIHPAFIASRGEKMIGTLECPVAPKEYILSSDASLWEEIRGKSALDLSSPPEKYPWRIQNFLDVTDHCNFHCPICGVSSGKRENPVFLAPEEACRRAKRLKESGGRNLTLLGGEPTVHPRLPEIIEKISSIGLVVGMMTNGYRLGTERGYAETLKKCGLSKVSLQFDTFDEEVHFKMRGNRYIGEKKTAITHVVKAGLRLGLIATITPFNLNEVGDILQFGLSLAPSLSTVVFQGAAPVERDPFREASIDRERILKVLLESAPLAAFSRKDIWPLPVFKPWSLQLHPDCAVNLILTTHRGTVKPVQDEIDLGKLYARMAKNKMGPFWIARNFVPLYYMLSAVKPGRRARIVKHLVGLISGKGTRSMVIVGVGSYSAVGFQDEEKIARCAASQWTSLGPVCACVYNLRGERCPGSRKSEARLGFWSFP